jgi:cell division protein FtsB
MIGYFGVNAFTGNHGLRAQQTLDEQFTALNEELGHLKQERAEWQHRVKLLQSNSIDPDTLDERARAVLNYLDPRELTLMIKRP